MNLPGYDEWKTQSPEDGCEFCGLAEGDRRACRGWQPEQCTGECGIVWRDPDAERDERNDR